MPGSLGSARYQELTERLIVARTDAGMTQAQVADRLGKPQSFVAKYEGGERRLDIIEFVDICHVLGVAPSRVVKDF